MTHLNLLSRAAVALCLARPVVAAQAVSCSAQSPAHTAALIKLHASKGYSICPPADR